MSFLWFILLTLSQCARRWKSAAPLASSRRSACAAVSRARSSVATATDSATRSTFHARRRLHGGGGGAADAPSRGPRSARARTAGRGASSGSASDSTVRDDDPATVDDAYRLSRTAHAPLSPSTEPRPPPPVPQTPLASICCGFVEGASVLPPPGHSMQSPL